MEARIAGRTATRVTLRFNDDAFGDIKAVMWVFERGQQGWIILCMGGDSASKTRTFDSIAKSFKFDS